MYRSQNCGLQLDCSSLESYKNSFFSSAFCLRTTSQLLLNVQFTHNTCRISLSDMPVLCARETSLPRLPWRQPHTALAPRRVFPVPKFKNSFNKPRRVYRLITWPGFWLGAGNDPFSAPSIGRRAAAHSLHPHHPSVRYRNFEMAERSSGGSTYHFQTHWPAVRFRNSILSGKRGVIMNFSFFLSLKIMKKFTPTK